MPLTFEKIRQSYPSVVVNHVPVMNPSDVDLNGSEGNQQPTNAQTASKGQASFRPPAKVETNAMTSTNFRPKQPIRRRAKRKSPPPSEPPSSSQSDP
ncbi:hypothetical protein PIB30_001526 [Stylosanthes scabra]|uniref:Uncharacterized protein n=1 Tax=Stylosanthes scabra TaxID=79078 RepID=A0ABU6R4W6_9FABA|nr:hypothetical protein [Stylosanthes scabra]